MIIRTRLFIGLLIVLAISVSAVSCSSDNHLIISQFMTVMEQSPQSCIKNMISDMASTEKQIDNIRINRAALEQVAAPAKEWVTAREADAKANNWGRRTYQVVEDLVKLRNDKYEVVKLVFFIEQAGRYISTIDILDLSANKVSPYESVKKGLDEAEELLIQQGNYITERMNLASVSLTGVLERYSEIQAASIDKNTYKISGALGLDSSNNLVQGQWLYYVDNNTIEPADAGSVALSKALLCK